MSVDEYPKPGTTAEALAKLRPAFKTDGGGTVTAGNASGHSSCFYLEGKYLRYYLEGSLSKWTGNDYGNEFEMSLPSFSPHIQSLKL